MRELDGEGSCLGKDNSVPGWLCCADGKLDKSVQVRNDKVVCRENGVLAKV